MFDNITHATIVIICSININKKYLNFMFYFGGYKEADFNAYGF